MSSEYKDERRLQDVFKTSSRRITKIDVCWGATYHATEYKVVNHHTKQSRRTKSLTRKTKLLEALFTYLKTQTVHFEIVRDLTKDAFILALRQFCSKRGYPHIIRNDNSKTFVGAESELKTALKSLDKKGIEEVVNDNQMKW